nr:unnamed protein product [Callosobruchus analis]
MILFPSTPYLLSGITTPAAPTWTWVYQWNAYRGWMRCPIRICGCRPSKAYPMSPNVIRSALPTVPIYNPIRKCNSMTNPFTHVMEAVKWQSLCNQFNYIRGCGRCFANTSKPYPCYHQQQAPYRKLPLKTALQPLIPAVSGCNDVRNYIKNCTENGTKECKRHVSGGCTNECSENICRCKNENPKPFLPHQKPLTMIPAISKQNSIQINKASHSENALTAHEQQVSAHNYLERLDNCTTTYNHGDQKSVEKFSTERSKKLICDYSVSEPPQRLAGKPKDVRKRDDNRSCLNRKDPRKCSCACTCNILTPENDTCGPNCPVKESCTHGTKKDINASTHKQIFMSTTEQISPTEVIYTDGSKTNEGVGAALATNRGVYRFKLNNRYLFAQQNSLPYYRPPIISTNKSQENMPSVQTHLAHYYYYENSPVLNL